MKTIVFGDIHGRPIWKDIVSQHRDADRFVFLGDYFTSREGISEEDQISNFWWIAHFAEMENENRPGRVILLRGNHDMEALGYEWAECSPWFRNNHYRNDESRQWVLDLTQWVFVDGDIVYSHAGVTTTWMKRNGLTDVNEINGLEPSGIFGFTPCKFSDYHGDSKTQPPTWVRPWTLFEDSFGKYTYIVGHTTTKCVIDIKQEVLDTEWGQDMYEQFKDKNQVWSCDCLGNGRYIVVEDGVITPCEFIK